MRLFVVLALVLASAAAPAVAERRGGRDDTASAQHAHVSQAQAVEIAAAQGVARVREVKLRDGNWKVEGFTSTGQTIEVEVNANTGAVVKRELY